MYLQDNFFLQIYVGLWILSVSLLGNVIFAPYEHKVTHYLESASIIICFISMLSGLTYFLEANQSIFDALSFGIFFINLVMIAVFVFIILGLWFGKTKQWLAKRLKKKNDAGEWDESTEGEATSESADSSDASSALNGELEEMKAMHSNENKSETQDKSETKDKSETQDKSETKDKSETQE